MFGHFVELALKGLGPDGASNMVGAKTGVAASINEIDPFDILLQSGSSVS